MDKEQITQEKIAEVLKHTNLCDYETEADTADELIESLQLQIDQEEVIYYRNGIDYLSENDASLNESLGIASEYGYSLENLNSEVLATILQQRNLSGELYEVKDELEECFEEEEEDNG